MCKTKDIQIYGIREIRSSPYSNELTNPKAMSSILLFRQMTAAAKRVSLLPSFLSVSLLSAVASQQERVRRFAMADKLR